MGSTRIKGKQLLLDIDGTDFWADATSVVLDNEDADNDVITFEDASTGGKQFFFTITAIQSTATGSFWRKVWENTGDTVPFTYAPHGNAEPSAGEPHFIGTLEIGPKPAIGGEAGADSTYTFETRFDVKTGPTLDTGESS